jgi:ribosome assembly protein YihI (activator of Der GTPase)
MSKFMDLSIQGDLIMAAIQDYIAKQDQFNSELEKRLANLRKDIEKLNSTIEKLQSTSGEISAEDQSLLDKAQARTESLLKSMGELDDLTPPDTNEVEEPPVGAPLDEMGEQILGENEEE